MARILKSLTLKSRLESKKALNNLERYLVMGNFTALSVAAKSRGADL
jgi:hypothetical protein